jgi:hypothetical protein
MSTAKKTQYFSVLNAKKKKEIKKIMLRKKLKKKFGFEGN